MRNDAIGTEQLSGTEQFEFYVSDIGIGSDQFSQRQPRRDRMKIIRSSLVELGFRCSSQHDDAKSRDRDIYLLASCFTKGGDLAVRWPN